MILFKSLNLTQKSAKALQIFALRRLLGLRRDFVYR